MPDGDASTPAPEGYYTDGPRGAGGKLRRERKPPPSPYARPPRTDNVGWISRIVTPARRFISDGATRLIPSFFSPCPSAIDGDFHSGADEEENEVEQGDGNHNESHPPNTVQHVVLKSTEVVGSSKAKGKSTLKTSGDAPETTKGSEGLPDIEQLIKGKTFSREEIDRLMEVLHSRVAVAEEEIEVPSNHAQEEADKSETPYGNQKVSADTEEELDKFKSASSTPFPRSSVREVQNEIGASPVDIARAYMGNRTSEVGFTSTSFISKRDKSPLGSEFSPKTLMTSPLQKTPICWPGAMTQDQQGYPTPQSQKRGYGFQKFPRTPYSRTMFTKSRSKFTPLLGDSEKVARMSSTPFQPIRTPVYGKSKTILAEGGYGSGGPIRRMRHNPMESSLPRTVQPSPLGSESDMDFRPSTSSANNFESMTRNNKNSDIGVARVHPHSSKLARQILEQLDRPITLKEKSDELKLGSSWRNSSQNNGSKLPVDTNGQINVMPPIKSNTFDAGKGVVSSSDVGPSSSFPKFDSQRATPDKADLQSKRPATSNSLGSEPHNAQRRPILSSISVDKPSLRTNPFASDTNSGFTFPFTTSLEPPTPSMIPSSSTSPDPKETSLPMPTSFTFANKITIAPPVNAIPTPNDVSTPLFKFGSGKTRLSFAVQGEEAPSTSNDSSLLKYKFGSGKNQLNFGSIGNDAVCY